jgi:hypothetical protein
MCAKLSVCNRDGEQESDGRGRGIAALEEIAEGSKIMEVGYILDFVVFHTP